MRKISNSLILILIIFSFSASAYAQGMNDNGSGGYVLGTFNDQKTPGIKEDGVIDQGLASFWQLPPYIQITYISLGLFAVFSLIKIFPFIFGRLKHVLENPKTKDIYGFIQRNPGVTVAELSKEQKINRGTLKYHLGQLLSNNKIMFVRKGKFLRLFYNNPRAMDKESIISRYLKHDKNKDFLFTIMDYPGITNQDLSQKFTLDKSTVTDYLKKFLDDGIIEYRQDGKFKRCYLQQDARMILLHHRPE